MNIVYHEIDFHSHLKTVLLWLETSYYLPISGKYQVSILLTMNIESSQTPETQERPIEEILAVLETWLDGAPDPEVRAQMRQLEQELKTAHVKVKALFDIKMTLVIDVDEEQKKLDGALKAARDDVNALKSKLGELQAIEERANERGDQIEPELIGKSFVDTLTLRKQSLVEEVAKLERKAETLSERGGDDSRHADAENELRIAQRRLRRLSALLDK